MQKKYLIFDLDGTLINSQSGLVDLICDFLEDHAEMTKDEMKYLFHSTAGTPLEIQMSEIFGCEKKGKEFSDKIYEKILSHNQKNPAQFFDGIPEKIKELSKKYKLFLTTGNHTEFAKEVLEKGGILDSFEEVYGSDKIHKGREHLEIFKENSCDENFFEKAIYVGDGNSDREFAGIFDIDFIHIGSEKKDKYEIKSVVEIDEILNKL